MNSYNIITVLKPMTFPIIPLAENFQHKTAALISMRRLYAGSVSYDATEKDLRELFEPFGLVTCLTLAWDNEKKHHKGFAFIEYDCAEAASLALQNLKGSIVNGRRLKLGRPQAALRYQSVFAQLEMEGRSRSSVYVSHIPAEASQEKILASMSQYGVVQRIRKQSKSSAYVDYLNKVDSEGAIRGFSNSLTICGTEVFVGPIITPQGLDIPIGSSFNNRIEINDKKRRRNQEEGKKRRKLV